MTNRHAGPRSDLRVWLRRIALGLPLVAAPPGAMLLVGWGGCGPCPGPEQVRYELSGEDLARVTRGGGIVVATECLALCRELDAGELPDGASRMLDSGVVTPFGSPNQCQVEGEGDVRILVCGYSRECGAGRRPAGLAQGSSARGVTSWLAHVAHLEAASVSAFEDLAAELRLAGAPRSLVQRALASAQDEVEHARSVGALAAERGAAPPRVVRARAPRRSLAQMALDNAVEGCVREAYGALAAAHQAQHARDADVRAAFTTIAQDEARHALLSEDIDAWARASEPALSPALRRARLDALRELAAELASPLTEEELALGLPSREFRRGALEALVVAA